MILSASLPPISSFHFPFSPSEPKPFPDLQCKDSWQSVLHGGSLSWGHEDLDGRDRDRCWGIHPVHGVVKVQGAPTCFAAFEEHVSCSFFLLGLLKCLDGYRRHLCWRTNTVRVVQRPQPWVTQGHFVTFLSASFFKMGRVYNVEPSCGIVGRYKVIVWTVLANLVQSQRSNEVHGIWNVLWYTNVP